MSTPADIAGMLAHALDGNQGSLPMLSDFLKEYGFEQQSSKLVILLQLKSIIEILHTEAKIDFEKKQNEDEYYVQTYEQEYYHELGVCSGEVAAYQKVLDQINLEGPDIFEPRIPKQESPASSTKNDVSTASPIFDTSTDSKLPQWDGFDC